MPSSCVSSGISTLCLTTSKRPHTRLSRSWPSNWRWTECAHLHDTGVHQWDVASLNPNRAKWLAQIGWKSTNQHLQHHRAVLAGAPRGRELGGGKRAWDPVEPRLVPSQTVVTAVLAHRARLEGMEVLVPRPHRQEARLPPLA